VQFIKPSNLQDFVGHASIKNNAPDMTGVSEVRFHPFPDAGKLNVSTSQVCVTALCLQPTAEN
jgi:hypothetical protein